MIHLGPSKGQIFFWAFAFLILVLSFTVNSNAISSSKFYTKRQPKFAICFLMIGSFSMSCRNFLTSLILSHREIPVEYRLMTSLPNTFPVFSPFSFSSLCLYSASVLLIISSIALSTLPCVCLNPNKFTLPLSMALFKYSRFLCCSMPSFGVSTTSPKTHHRLIYLQHKPLLLLLSVEIATKRRTILDIKAILIILL